MPVGIMFGVAMETGLKTALSPESAAASDIFDQFASAQTFKSVQGTFRLLCDCLHIKPTNFPNFYPKIRGKLRSWKAMGLWSKFDKRVNHKCYNRGKVCENTKVLVIGAGPCGLRTAIEAQLSGAKVVVIEKRDRFSRNNVLHLWPFVIHDLRNLGAKKFYGKFCAGAIDHISIRQLQCVLLKVALLLGVEVHENVAFDDLIEPPDDQSQEKIGWRASLSPSDHPVSQYEFDVLIGADGKRNTLKSFKRKEFRGKLAIAITANFINRHSEAEARVQEISGIAFIFNQKFFQDLRDHTGIDLENIVYYKDETHYFVMTAKKHSLIEKGVIINDYADTARLLSPDNVNREALLDYAREAADFSTNCQMPNLDFAVNHYGQADVAMFDFTSMFQAESACRVIERRGHKLLQALVGDSLLEPFWPTGSGCARGFLSSLDACWMIRSWSLGKMSPLQILAERESVYRLLAQTVPENLSKGYNEHTMDPSSRYRDLNLKLVRPAQVRPLYDTDGEIKDEPLEIIDLPKKKRKRDSVIHPDTLLSWCQRQLTPYNNVTVDNMTTSWQSGLALCAIIHRYRPDLLDFHALSAEETAANNQLAFDVCEREYGILPVMSGQEMAESEQPDVLAVLSYVTQIYETFRGEIPHVARAPMTDLSPDDRPTSPSRKSPVGRMSLLARLQRLATKKRYSLERERERDRKLGALMELDGEKEASEMLRRIKKRRSLERDRALFILNQDSAQPTLTGFKNAGPSLENRENFSSRVKDLEQKLYGTEPRSVAETTPTSAHKVGRIGRGDWNVKMLEERLKGIKPENKKEKEHVPKWSKDIFEDKKRTMDQKLNRESPDEPAKFINFDSSLTMLEKKLKDGNNLEIGQRGSNKVSAISAALESRPTTLPLQRSNSKPCTINTQNASETCHFCRKRVYLMEQLSAQGKFFHRGCFKCECCGITLRLSNYGVGTEGPYMGHFLCMHHFNTRVLTRKRATNDVDSAPKAKLSSPSSLLPRTPNMLLDVTHSVLEKSRGMTPERAEFENTLDVTSEEELFSEIDEDEWTDRNFGMSANEYESSEEESDMSSDEISEEELEAAIQKPLTADQTWKLAANFKKRLSRRNRGETVESDEEEGDSATDDDDEEGEYGGSSEDEYSYQEYENEDEESTATEGEAEGGDVQKESDKTPVGGDIQLPVPTPPDVAVEESVPNTELDYQVLKSNELTGSEGDAGSDASEDSEDYTDDTETESDENDYAEEGVDGDADSEADEQDVAVIGSRRHRRRHHSIPTIVIDESTGCAPSEDDDAYFIALREQSRQAERTLDDLIRERPTNNVTPEHSVAPTPETPLTPAFGVPEEMRPLVATNFAGVVDVRQTVTPSMSEPHTPVVQREEALEATLRSPPTDESSFDLSRTPEDPDIMGPLLDVAFIAESTLSDDGDSDIASPSVSQSETFDDTGLVRDQAVEPLTSTEKFILTEPEAPLSAQLSVSPPPTLPVVSATMTVTPTIDDPPKETKPLIPYMAATAIRLDQSEGAKKYGSDPDVVAVKPTAIVPDHISSRLIEEPPLVTVARIAFDKRTSQELSSSLPDLARTKDGSGGTSPIAGATISGSAVPEIPTAKSKMLKLKEQYLLGNHAMATPMLPPLPIYDNVGGSGPSTLRRSPHDSVGGSSPKLEPVVRSLLDLISEKQKMLSPAPSPSPTAILQRPHGFTFGEVSPSSVSLASVLSSSSEPLAAGAAVAGSSPTSWSQISNVSPLEGAGSLSFSSPTAFSAVESSRVLDSRSPPSMETELPVAEEIVNEEMTPDTAEHHQKSDLVGSLNSVPSPHSPVCVDAAFPPPHQEISAGHVEDVVLDVVIAAECPSPACPPDACVLTSSSADLHPPEACTPTTNCDPIVNDVVVFSKTLQSPQQQPSKTEYEKDPHPMSLSPSLVSPSLVNINIDAEQPVELWEDDVIVNHLALPSVDEKSSPADDVDLELELLQVDDTTIFNVDETFVTFRDESKRTCPKPSEVGDNTFGQQINPEKNPKIEVDIEISPPVVAVTRTVPTYAGREPKQSYRDKFQKLGLFRSGGDTKSVAADEALRMETTATAITAESKLDLLNENEILTTADERQNNEHTKLHPVTDNCQFSSMTESPGADSQANVRAPHCPNRIDIDDGLKGADDDDDDDDDSLGMLSTAESSDSDMTPNLDESIYSTPAADVLHKSLPVKHPGGGGSYVGHFADRSFPFGGVRDSIDIRKSALKRVPSYPTQPFRQAELTSLANSSDRNANFGNSSMPLTNETMVPNEKSSGDQGAPTSGTSKVSERKFPSIEDLDAIPFVDDESSSNSERCVSGSKNERFFTPRTSYKRPLQRPLSMVETRSTYSPFPSPTRRFLPDTPLTHPQQMLRTPRQTYGEAIDDLRQLRETCTVERERARQEARERARLKSDEELGLSIIDYTNLRRKYQKPELRHSLSLEEERSFGRSPRDDGQESLYLPVELEMWANEGTSSDEEGGVDDRSSVPTSTTANTSEALRDASSDVYGEPQPRLETQSQESSSPDSDVFEVFSPVTSPVPSAPAASPALASAVVHADSATTVVPEPAMTDVSSPEQLASGTTTDTGTSFGSSPDGNVAAQSASSPATDSAPASALSRSDYAAYLEPSVISVEDLNLSLSPDGAAANKNFLSPVIAGGKPKSNSLPGLMMRKDKSKVQTPPATASIKPKERKSLLSILTSFAKSDSGKNKAKDKEEKNRDKKKEKSPTPSSPLTSTSSESAPSSLTTPPAPFEVRPLKVDGTPKESRFPKLRLARSKEKAKEKRKQKHLAACPGGGGDAGVPVAVHVATSPVPIPSATVLPRVVAVDTFRPQSYPSANRRLDLIFDRNQLIASMASISRKIPPSPNLLDKRVAPQASEDSFSDTEDDRTEDLSQASTNNSGKKMKDIAEERKRKLQKMAQRVYRQQEQKRLRTAQEIQRQLEELDANHKELEVRGVCVEKALRGEGDVEDVRKEEAELMQEWFRLVHAKNLLVRQEQDIMVKAKELELEDRHSRLQHQLSQRMAIDDMKKSPEEMEEEGRILAELLEIVEQRDTLISLLEENRQRHQEEDEDLELNMQAKGLRLSPTSPTSSAST